MQEIMLVSLSLLLPLAIGHGDIHHLSQSTSVPGPPEWATLEVIGSNTLLTSFAPPLWDGGSPIMSFLVEWDKEAGIPEVQRIAISQDLNSNEIQSITTSLVDLNEIQVIRTSAKPQAEVQTITISPPSGDATIDSAYSFAISLDNIETGGSLQYSGQISANADPDGSRSSVAQILENMSNIYGRPMVKRSGMNPDGGHTYHVTFPLSMGNVPEMKVFKSDLPVAIATLHHGNELSGSFRIEFMGELTADIPFDASSSEMQGFLESLESIGAVSVTRSVPDEQYGFTWEIEFLSDSNAGNIDNLMVHGDGLKTSNFVGGANIENLGGRDGSYISGSFIILYRGWSTEPIPFDADSSTMKIMLEELPTIGFVSVHRSDIDVVGGCTWTISFLEDEFGSNRGDLPLMIVESSLTGSPGQTPSVEVVEQRKGTWKEIQTIATDGGGDHVDPASSFRLRFGDEETNDILALPLGGTTCLGSTTAKQLITTSTVDTSDIGGDDSVSKLTSFSLSYESYSTSKIMANTASCEETSNTIARELMKLPPLHKVIVSGSDTGGGDQGCSWTVTFLSVMGNPALMKVTAYNINISAGPGSFVTLGGATSIIQDSITISQPDDFIGDINLIQYELSKLSAIGVVTVSPLTPAPDEFGQCVWKVTFESKAGNVPSIEVAKSGTTYFSTLAQLHSNDRIVVTDNTVQGTSTPVSGDFRLEFDGEVTGYMPFDASAEEMKTALEALSNVGDVVVTRQDPDVNGCFIWDVTFVSDFGPLPLLNADDLDLKGTATSMSVSKAIIGILPTFNGPDYGSQVISDTSDLSLLISNLKQGIPYYVRISVSNMVGMGPSIMPYPPFQIPLPQPPTSPSKVEIKSRDGSTLSVSIYEPFSDGGSDIISYRVDHSAQPFVHEKQRISLSCSPQPDVQSVTTSAADINEIQYLVFDSTYRGNGEVLEVQSVFCDATGGVFGLTLGGETAYISHNYNANEIKAALEALPSINQVSVTFNNGRTSACVPYDGFLAGDFSITFISLSGISGDIPLLTVETSGLDGSRHVDVFSMLNGDAPLSGSLKLSFRGAVSQAIDIPLESSDLADAIDNALEGLDTIEHNGVVVTSVHLENGGFEMIFKIEFIGDGVGGNVEPLIIVPEHKLVVGSAAEVFLLTDGETYTARNGIDSVTSRVGNELSGYYRLKLRGHTTGRIPFNSSVDQIKNSLQELENVGEVNVQRRGPSKEMAYSWMITFLSNPGYFPPSARDVDVLEAVNELSTSVESDTSASISIAVIQDGDDRLSGTFVVTFDSGTSKETTRPLQSFISAEELKEELESLSNIGRVNVVRSQSLIGYDWDIEFASCALKNGSEICNDGDLLPLLVSSMNLQGCGGPQLHVSKLVAGGGFEPCPHSNNGLCSEESRFSGEYPIVHHIIGLSLGTSYYVQVRFRNSQGYGYRQLSHPLFIALKHNPPGKPPPVVLKESTSTSITIGWREPRDNGGKAVSGYELWMDTWSGGATFMVYDGAGSPNIKEYHMKANDVGSVNHILETGRQYRFQVRAINNCEPEDAALPCYGEFSEVQIFTVRDPRPPLAPSMPRRDSRTRVLSSEEAIISVSWSPPIDNGGSPITGYILYVKFPDGTMANHAFGSDTTMWQQNVLYPGEVYHFHVIAINAVGKSGNSPVLSIMAAMSPGLNYNGQPTYSHLMYRPIIANVQKTSLTIKWSYLPVAISGGTPITGFKVYLYQNVKPISHDESDPIKQEVQHIVISSPSSVTGTFTISFRGFETDDIPVDSANDEIKAALENLRSINVVNVESVINGWSVTFLSEAGDLPLMGVTSGRLLGDDNAKIIVSEVIKGDTALLIYDGSESPAELHFEALNLTPDVRYAFKVTPLNSIGEGVLSYSSIATVTRSGASSSRTTASGSALSHGIAGFIREQQIVTFLSDDCTRDKLILSFSFSHPTNNLCGVTAAVFESAINKLSGVGDVHVSREEVTSSNNGGYSWTVTFKSFAGDVPLLSVDLSQVGSGKDASGLSLLGAAYVVEFLKGQANEFVIEPKTASGTPVTGIDVNAGIEGGDIFFTELWMSEASVIDGSHTWYSDGGVSTYNPIIYEQQVIAIPKSARAFFLLMDTTEAQPKGRLGGIRSETDLIEDLTEMSLQDALSKLPNVGKVIVTRRNQNDESIYCFVVTFRDFFGEMPLLSASDPSITISHNGDQNSAAEVQSITISSDVPFKYEVQSILISSSCISFDLSLMSGASTNPMPCNFANIDEANDAKLTLEAELNALPGIKVQVDSNVIDTGEENDRWNFRVTFIEPVGPSSLLSSLDAKIIQVVQGESTLSGSFVLSYQGEYTNDISFDATASDVKSEIESLDSIVEVDVKRIDKYTGYQWVVSFIGNAGNLQPLVAHNAIFPIQSIEIMGGKPTPIGGTFKLSYMKEKTSLLPHDCTAEMMKFSLESLSSIDRVDISQQVLQDGQNRWFVTFRSPSNSALLEINSSTLSGTVMSAKITTLIDFKSPSLLADSGSRPMIVVEETVPGLPSYSGQYIANATGAYSLAVFQLESGGLNSFYYDNQWLLDEPVVKRVDSTINFDWGSGIITQYGRDYVSVRWWGKVQALTSEPYTFYLSADDGAKLYIDHNLVIDVWEEFAMEKKVTISLKSGSFHDLKIEYKEITGSANIKLQWSSRSLKKQVIPQSQLFHASHIVGSPFLTVVTPGAADYPYSDFVDFPGKNRSLAIAGGRTSFYLQAKDSSGNNKTIDEDAQGDLLSLEQQFTVDIVGNSLVISGDVTYIGSGQYRVDFIVLKVGTYQVYVKTGGTDIYCGLGELNKCSPFRLIVSPGNTLASNSEAESSFDPVDSLVEARAGDIGIIYLQTKDAFGNNRWSGGDEIVVKFVNVANSDIRYRGNILDKENGSYIITYSIPLAGNYHVSISIGDEPVKYCVGPSGERWNNRQYDGRTTYSSPHFCSQSQVSTLKVVHNDVHGLSSSLINEEGLSGLSNAVVGVETGFIIQSRDKFGNLRSGSSTEHIRDSGDGMSDVFLVKLISPSGYTATTSSAVQILTSSDSSVSGYFRLSYGGRTSLDIPHDISSAAMQVVLSSMHGRNGNTSVHVSRSDKNGNFQWTIIFIDHFELWSKDPLIVLPGSDGLKTVSDLLNVSKSASAGIYPIRYTLWEKGVYLVSVISGSSLVSGSSYTLEVVNGAPQSSSSSAHGLGLKEAVAGIESSFEVIVRDQRQSEIQSIMALGAVVEFVNEIQCIQVTLRHGDTFQVEFRGQKTRPIEVGQSTVEELENSLEELFSIGDVSTSSDGSSIIQSGDRIEVEFLTESGSLDLMKSSSSVVISKLRVGEAPYRAERQSFYCDADGGFIILFFNELTVTINFDDDMESVLLKLSALVGSTLSIVEIDTSLSTVCNAQGKQFFVDFSIAQGDVEPISVSFDALENGSMLIYGNGEGQHGAINGCSPIMGYFKVSYEGMTTIPISIDASADDLKIALESFTSIGSVTVSKDVIGIRQGSHNAIQGITSLFSIWSITFADENQSGCHPGTWLKCPPNIGDMSPLEIDSSLLRNSFSATHQQSTPIMQVFEVRKGSSGNLIDAVDGISLRFNMFHDIHPWIGIGMNKVLELSCSYLPEALQKNDNSGSFEIKMSDQHVKIDSRTKMFQLKNIMKDKFRLTGHVSISRNSNDEVCKFDPENPANELTRLTFSEEDGALPDFYVYAENNLIVRSTSLVDAVKGITYMGGGRFQIRYMPKLSGHYSSSIQVNNKYLWSDYSSGIIVYPAEASAQHSTHNSKAVGVAGVEEIFYVITRDRFGNRLFNVFDEMSVLVNLHGTSHSCNGNQMNDTPAVTISRTEIGNEEGHYQIKYTPILAGQYKGSVMLRSKGGLLATYYKNHDFSQPVHGNIHYHDILWCAKEYICDSTRLDNVISFFWAYESPLPSDISFPIESFSITWFGDLKVDVSNEYNFVIKLNGGVRMMIGEEIIIDNLTNVNAEFISSAPVTLEQDIFYPLRIDYSHSNDEAYIELQWESLSMARQIVPSSALFFTRHIGGSPLLVEIIPGNLSVTIIAHGDGLETCVSMEECSFTIQTKDKNRNNRFNDGKNPRFDISIIANDGLTREGHMISMTHSYPTQISDIYVHSNDWTLIGPVRVTQFSHNVLSNANFLGSISRGDNVVIDGVMYSVSLAGIFNATNVPLLSPYLSSTKADVLLYKASKSCLSGTHTVTYIPKASGSYLIDVKIPSISEIQRVTTQVLADSSLSGAFTLSYGPITSDSIRFNSFADEFKKALESIKNIQIEEITLNECQNPTISCSWDITFASQQGDIDTPVVDKDQLFGDGANVNIEELVKGQQKLSISGFPRTLNVSTGKTSPLQTTAYGKGLISATAGVESTFIIQPKDSFGNDVLDQRETDVFGVYVYPEQRDINGLYPIIQGEVVRHHSGYYLVTYTPYATGFYTVAIVLSVDKEQQVITTGYNTKARGGTFTISLNKKSSIPIRWDATEEDIEAILNASFPFSSFGVEKKSYGLFNFRYVVSFKTAIGDVPDMVVETSGLTGNAEKWNVTSLVDGKFTHIKMAQHKHEIQSITLVKNNAQVSEATFSLGFMGRRTEPIPWNADLNTFKDKVEKLTTVGDISLSSTEIDPSTIMWRVTFNPYEGLAADGVTNFGNLPLLESLDVHENITVYINTIQDGQSLFRLLVTASEPSAEKTIAFDYSGIDNFEGLSTGIYASSTHFFLQTRDNYLNEVHYGPLNDVQIIETFSSSHIEGSFEISIFGGTVHFDASAFVSEIEKGLQSIPGIGSVTVSSNSAKDLIVGKTVAVTKGLSTVIPNLELSEFVVGDWIRIGNQKDGQIFSIIELSDIFPFAVTLSSPYVGDTTASAPIYQHGTPHDRKGYQYIVSFDSVLGDVPKLKVKGSFVNSDAKIDVIYCDRNIVQELQIHAISSYTVTGYFYLIYRNQKTRLLSVGASSEDIIEAIQSDIAHIHSVYITDEQVHSFGAKSWTIRLQSFDDDAQLFFAESYLISGGFIEVTTECPLSSPHSLLYSATAVAGRQGQDFVVALDGASTVYGSVCYLGDGKYQATYKAPRVGKYVLSVRAANPGGLTGEYFNNRWLHGLPISLRVDRVIDFKWGNADTVTPTGKDFVSVRWTGYIKPSFDEIYTFTARVNDALRLWISDDLLIDEYDNEVDDQNEFLEFSARTKKPLNANQLVAIKIEYRENRGTAMIQLFWESFSQPYAIIDNHRLFYNASHVAGSQSEVVTQAIEPGKPTNCSLSIAGWNSLKVFWSIPDDDGGVEITKYYIEYWDANEYGETEIQQLRLKQTINGGTFDIYMLAHKVTVSLPTSALIIEQTLERLPSVGDVDVTRSFEAEFIVFNIEFLTDNAPVRIIDVDMTAAFPESERGEYCVCAKGRVQCVSGSPTLTCDASSTREGSLSTDSIDINVASIKNDGIHFSHCLENLEQPSNIPDGFGVRIYAQNIIGIGVPCKSMFLKPKGLPMPPVVIEIERVASSASSLALHFTAVSHPDNRGAVVNFFFLEWSTTKDFLAGSTSNLTLGIDDVKSERLSSYKNTNKEFHHFVIKKLIPGTNYFVKLAAINELGIGPSRHSTPVSLAPGSKPSDMEEQSGVTLSVIVSDKTVSVLKSCSSLRVSWRVPLIDNGFNVSQYLVEYWVSDGINEIQEISLQSHNHNTVRGTFTLGYGNDMTDSLPVDTSAEDLKASLESLSSIRSVKVWRSGENPYYKWTVTFLSEFPSVSGSILKVIDGATQLMDGSSNIPNLQVTVLTPGTLPIGYNTEVVLVKEALKTHYDVILNDLTAGQSYRVQVSAANKLGYGHPQPSVPRELAPPFQKPSEPTNVLLQVASSQSLEITFSKPISDGGDIVTMYRIEWDTNPEFDSNNNSPLGYHSFIPTKEKAGCDPCTYQILGLIKGEHYFVRVYAYNSYGYSVDPGVPTPFALAPKTSPNPPEILMVSPHSDTEVEVLFPHSSDDGGAPVMKYKILWNSMGYSAGMTSRNRDRYSLLYSYCNIQTITLSASDSDIRGTFRVAFEKHATKELSVKSTGYDMKLALESLPTIGSVVVSRQSFSSETIWSVSFLTNIGHKGIIGPIESLAVSIDPTETPEMFVRDTLGISSTTLFGIGVRLVVNEEVTAFKGFEQQMLKAQCSSSNGVLSGVFSITFGSESTNEIPFNVSALELKVELEKISAAGTLQITRQKIQNRINSFQWNLIFIEHLGNVPLIEVHDHLTCSDGSGRPLIYASEIIQGISPRMDGPLAGSIEIDAIEHEGNDIIPLKVSGLMRGMSYHFQVAAWNGVGGSFGHTRHSTPATIIPRDRPDPPSTIEMSPIDHLTLQIDWIDVFNKIGSYQITKYRIEVIEWSINDSEVQQIYIAASNHIGGTFRVGFAGFWTPYIAVSVEEHKLKHVIDELPNTRDVIVRKHSIGANSTSWMVTFQKNVGNQPSMLIDSSRLTGDKLSALTLEVKPGVNAGFDHSSTKLLRTYDVDRIPEIQVIILESSADDVGGFFSISFMGIRSSRIFIDFDAQDVKDALEGISIIGIVDVTVTHNNWESLAAYGQSWVITFISQEGNLPSLLVDTGSSVPSTIATGGTLYGSSSIIRVETIRDGNLPTTFITPSTFDENKAYTSRVYAFNGNAWSSPLTSEFAISPTKVAPSPPRRVKVKVLSDTELGVSWMQPMYSGGDSLTGYKVQWDNDAMFDSFSTTVSHQDDSDHYYFVIDNLDPMESYFVRVMAFSIHGFSEPQMATSLFSNLRTVVISLVETNGQVDFSETFKIQYSKSYRVTRTTKEISVYATSQEVENELNQFGFGSVVSVDREDRSSVFDSSGIETNFFDIRYKITFVADEDISLIVDDESLGSIIASVHV